MAPMQKKGEKKGGEKKEVITVEVKKEITEKYERGMWVARIARFDVSGCISSAEEEEKKEEESLTSNEIREMCKMWGTEQHFVEKHHPNRL